MPKDLEYYNVTPRILPAGKPANIHIRPLGNHARFEKDTAYTVKLIPLHKHPLLGEEHLRLELYSQDGSLTVPFTPDGEQEYRLAVYKGSFAPDAILTGTPVTTQRVYSLLPDLFALRPYRGDFHVHTCYSDGEESPAVVAANYRKAGFDFLAITDHRVYQPSLEAIAAYKDEPADIALFPGEEVHAPDNDTHIINFGGGESVNAFFRDQPERYAREVAAIEESLSMPANVNKHSAAAAKWAFDRIRQSGGIAVYPHPHWLTINGYHGRDEFSRYLFEHRLFDAFELLGGQTVRENNMQTAFYSQMRAEGFDVPVIGASDSHGTVDVNWFRWQSTIVLSRSLDFADIRESVLKGQSVAVESYPGEEIRAHGPYRIVQYALFLLDTYFYPHDELCFEEGIQMKALVTGDDRVGERQSARENLMRMKGRTARFMAAFFGE